MKETCVKSKLLRGFLRKFLALGIIVGLLLTNYSVASASTNEPTSYWNLNKYGTYSGSGKANNSNLYSNYYFTGVSRMKFSVVNKGSDTITVNVYREDGGWTSYYRTYIPSYGSASWTMNVTSSKKYELRFSHPSYFTFTVQKG